MVSRRLAQNRHGELHYKEKTDRLRIVKREADRVGGEEKKEEEIQKEKSLNSVGNRMIAHFPFLPPSLLAITFFSSYLFLSVPFKNLRLSCQSTRVSKTRASERASRETTCFSVDTSEMRTVNERATRTGPDSTISREVESAIRYRDERQE